MNYLDGFVAAVPTANKEAFLKHAQEAAVVRGHSCLLSGETSPGRIIHVVCSPKADYLAIITAYIPEVAEWDETKRQRRKGSQ